MARKVQKEPPRLPCCGAVVTGQTQMSFQGSERRPPREGDLSICGDCGHWLRFGKGMTLRRFTADDFLEVTDAELTVMRRMSAMQRLSRRSQR